MATSDGPLSPAPESPALPPAAPAANGVALHELERRVRALEDAVARLDNPRVLEERITERLKQAPVATAAPAPDNVPSVALPSLRWGGAWSSWLFLDMAREARTMVQLILDRRYAMAWTTRLVVAVLLPVILTSHWWFSILFCGFPWIDGLRGLLINALNLILAFFLYKAMSREARRYNEQSRG